MPPALYGSSSCFPSLWALGSAVFLFLALCWVFAPNIEPLVIAPSFTSKYSWPCQQHGQLGSRTLLHAVENPNITWQLALSILIFSFWGFISVDSTNLGYVVPYYVLLEKIHIYIWTLGVWSCVVQGSAVSHRPSCV